MKHNLFEAVLQCEGKVHVALSDFGMSAPRLAEQFLHAIREMTSQANRSIGQDLHALIAAERLKIAEIQFKTAILRSDKLGDLIQKSFFTVRSQAHNFAFIAIFAVSDEFANHRIETAQ